MLDGQGYTVLGNHGLPCGGVCTYEHRLLLLKMEDTPLLELVQLEGEVNRKLLFREQVIKVSQIRLVLYGKGIPLSVELISDHRIDLYTLEHLDRLHCWLFLGLLAWPVLLLNRRLELVLVLFFGPQLVLDIHLILICLFDDPVDSLSESVILDRSLILVDLLFDFCVFGQIDLVENVLPQIIVGRVLEADQSQDLLVTILVLTDLFEIHHSREKPEFL